jgi:hypothetical protein
MDLIYLFQANIKLSATQLQPAESVDITVDAKCNSYIGLLGIDQSVNLLKSGEKRIYTLKTKDGKIPTLVTYNRNNYPAHQ